jgi:hypothetical protein
MQAWRESESGNFQTEGTRHVNLDAFNERRPEKNRMAQSSTYHGRGGKRAALKEGERLSAAQGKHGRGKGVGSELKLCQSG